MNYIAEINAFEQWLETHYLPISSQLLWYKLMSINNRAGWSEWVTVDNLRLMAAMQMGREATLIKARDGLIKAGVIEYQKGKKGSPNRYHLISLTDGNTCKSVVQSEVQTVAKSEVYPVVKSAVQSADIYKHKQNKKENSPPISPVVRMQDFLVAYPGKANNYQTGIAYADLIMTGKVTEDELVAAAQNYADECTANETEKRYIKRAENFLKDMSFTDYLPGKYQPPEKGEKIEDGYYGVNAWDL